MDLKEGLIAGRLLRPLLYMVWMSTMFSWSSASEGPRNQLGFKNVSISGRRYITYASRVAKFDAQAAAMITMRRNAIGATKLVAVEK